MGDPDDLRRRIWKHTEALAKRCESPAERIVIDSMTVPAPVDLQGQVRVNAGGHNYRLDFAVPGARVAFEIDGHAYHSSRKARARDAVRDRRLQAAGWRVFRYTSDEVFHNPFAVAHEILEITRAVVK